jgi:hypothetical protein
MSYFIKIYSNNLKFIKKHIKELLLINQGGR